MRFNYKILGIAAGAAILSLSITACHGQYPGASGYVPTTTTGVNATRGTGGTEPLDQKGDIDSGCGTRVHIVIAGILNCRFHEQRYKGTFTIVNDEQGIVVITPMSGTQATKFTILGLVVGSGHILVKDSKGNEYTMHVKVTL